MTGNVHTRYRWSLQAIPCRPPRVTDLASNYADKTRSMVPLSGSLPTIIFVLLSMEIVWASLGAQHGIWLVGPPQLAVSHIGHLSTVPMSDLST